MSFLSDIIIFIVYAISASSYLWLSFNIHDYRKWLYRICGVSFFLLTCGVYFDEAFTFLGLLLLVIVSALHGISRSIELFSQQKGFCIKQGKKIPAHNQS